MNKISPARMDAIVAARRHIDHGTKSLQAAATTATQPPTDRSDAAMIDAYLRIRYAARILGDALCTAGVLTEIEAHPDRDELPASMTIH